MSRHMIIKLMKGHFVPSDMAIKMTHPHRTPMIYMPYRPVIGEAWSQMTWPSSLK